MGKSDPSKRPLDDEEWRPLPAPPPRAFRSDLTSIALALLGMAPLIAAALHARVDRARRTPVVTWVGPAAGWIGHLAAAGWLLSFAAVVLGQVAMLRGKGDRRFLGLIGLGLGFANIFLGCVFYAAIYED